MRLRRVDIGGHPTLQIATEQGWVNVPDIVHTIPHLHDPFSHADVVDILSIPPTARDSLQQAAEAIPPAEGSMTPLLPFQPTSYRDFMLYERHVIDSIRGYTQRFLPINYRIARLFERASGKPYPAFKPKPLWYRQPIYYMGNHLAFIGDGALIPWPEYCTVLDYELELGFVLKAPLLNATPQEAEAAIGGFVIFNDISARNVQRDEMISGFGPQKAKHFCNVMGAEVVTADAILPQWQTLTGEVRINGKTISRVSTRGPQFTLGEALAHASRSEQLHAGEFFGTGCLPGGSGLENGQTLDYGDHLELVLHEIGVVKNQVTLRKRNLSGSWGM